MMIILILFSVLFAIVAWLLIAPFQLQIDSRRNHYRLHWKSIGYGQLLIQPSALAVRLKIFFWQKDWPLFPPARGKPKLAPKANEPQKTDEPKKDTTTRPSLFKLMALLRTFQLKKFRLHVDTDDYILNSYLYPVFYFLNGKNRELRINYQGDLLLQMVVENRLYRLLVAYLR